MFYWLAENWCGLVVGFVLVGVVALVVIKMVRDRKKGKTACGCNCDGCSLKCNCRRSQNAICQFDEKSLDKKDNNSNAS